jgi:hypothetical protein
MKLLPLFAYLLLRIPPRQIYNTCYRLLFFGKVMKEFGLLIQHESYIYKRSGRYKEEHFVLFTHECKLSQGKTYSGKLKTESIFKEHKKNHMGYTCSSTTIQIYITR